MSKHIYRYEVPVDDEWHSLPFGRVVFVTPERRLRRDRLEVWVETTESADPIRLRVFGTGQPIPETATHVQSVRDDPFVWHIYQQETGDNE